MASGEPGSGGERELRVLSVVTPMFDEEESARAFYDRTAAALAGIPFEMLVVDDGSRDGTAAVLQEIAAADDRVRVLRLSRNFGHQVALTAGLDHASGDAIVMLDADLQDPPELIVDMVDRWKAGADVVYAVRRGRAGETRFKLLTARLFYGLIARMSAVELPADSGDFRLMDRRALDAVLSMRERNRYLRGMTVWIGFTQTAIEYDRDARRAGETKYPLRKMVRFAVDALASFSHVPLQLATVLGFVFAAMAFIGIPVAIGFRIAGQFVPGVTSTVIAVLLLGGIQLIALGLIGEYVGRIYDEVKGRPLYFVRETVNLPPPAAAEDGRGDLPSALGG